MVRILHARSGGLVLQCPRAIIFDWDNTLVDSWRCIQAAMNVTLAAMGHAEWGLEETKARVALSLRDLFPTLFGERWGEAREVFYRTFAAIHLDYLQPLPGVPAMLEALRRLGVHLAVVSNKNGGFLRQEAQHLGWNSHFDRLVGATDAAADKPSAAPVLLALQAIGVPPGETVWLVGDQPVDVECAMNSGCAPVLLRQEPPRQGEFALLTAPRHIDRCDELTHLVRELLVPISPN